MDLIIVESPNKIKSIKKYAGSGFIVKASVGHFREMPQNDLGVNEDTLEEVYVTSKNKENIIQDISDTIKKYQIKVVFLATDDDREGEAISWHLKIAIEEADCNVIFKRIRIREITEKGVKEALGKISSLDMQIVEAQRSRRVVDRLTGYKISPILWSKFQRKGLSAGRVQSAILAILSKRDREIKAFTSTMYYGIRALVQTQPSFQAQLTIIKNGVDQEKVKQLSKEEAEEIASKIKELPFKVDHIETKELKRNPQPPFTTATLQQEVSQKLGFSSAETMKIAQSLFEKGLITYHRTDSVSLSTQAIEDVRDQITQKYGVVLLPDTPVSYKSGEAAQEAHEAIRPSTYNPTESLTHNETELFNMIVNRTLASQMVPAVFEQLNYHLTVDKYVFIASGKKTIDHGYLVAYDDNDKETQEDQAEENTDLPMLNLDDLLTGEIQISNHTTKPPGRYTEKSLLQQLDKLGVGRPSTWAPMIEKVKEKQYIEMKTKKFFVTELGLYLDENLQAFFPGFLNVDATAHMENELDNIANGKGERIPFLKMFYQDLATALNNASSKMETNDLNPTEKIQCFICKQPMNQNLKVASCQCGLKIFRKIFQKELTDVQWKSLLEKGETSLIKDFTSSKNNTFSARLKIDKEKKQVVPVFEENPNCSYCDTGKIRVNEKTISCNQCGFLLFKTVCQKKLTKSEINKLIKGKKTDVIKGFKGANGEFEAALSWDQTQKKIKFLK